MLLVHSRVRCSEAGGNFLPRLGQVEVLTAARRNRSKAYTAKLVLDEKEGKVKLDFGVESSRCRALALAPTHAHNSPT